MCTPAFPPPLRDPDCLKGPKYLNVCSRLPPASQRPRLPESTHFGTFKGPKIPKCVLPPPPPPLRDPDCLGVRIFGIFKGPKYLNVYSRLPPPLLRDPDCLGARILELSRAQMGVRILELSRAQNKMCTPASPPPLRDPDCLEARILELSRAQNT